MGRNFFKKFLILMGILSFLTGVWADDSRNHPVTATYCDGTQLQIYPYSVAVQPDGTSFNDYEVQVTPIENGLRYGFEDWTDYDYNDVVIDLWITGNGTGSPVAHVRYVSKESADNHKVHIVYGETDVFVFDANESTPGQVFDIPLPTVECPDFSINVTPPQRSIYPGEETFYTVVVQSIGGFSEPVNLSVEGLPQGATASFDQNPITPTGETKMRIQTSPSTPPGTYTLTVKGTSGEMVHSATVTLTIKECPGFQVKIEAEPTSGPVPLTVQFNAEVEGEGEFTYHWDFGDGGTSTEKSPKYTYTSPGDYTVTLEVENQCGKKQSATITINAFGFEGTISKRFLKTQVSPGEDVAMAITIKNSTKYDFEKVEVWDELSPYLEYQSDEAPVKPRFEGNKIIWDFPKIESGGRIHFRVFLKVRKDAPDTEVRNIAYLTHSSLSQPIESNEALLKIVAPQVRITKSVDKAVASPGDEILYTILVENPSQVDIGNFQLEDNLSKHLDFLSQEGNFSFTRQGRKLVWKGILKHGAKERLTIKAKIKETVMGGTSIVNRAMASAPVLREKIYSNTVRTTISANPIPSSKVIFRKKAEIPQSEVGKIIRFRLIITNRSSSSLINPSIDDFLPQGFRYVKGTTLYNGQRFRDPSGQRHLHWELPLIKGMETVILRYQVIIGSDAKRGKNVNRAILRAMDNSGQNLSLQAEAFVNVSSSGFIFYSGVEGFVYLDRNKNGVLDAEDTPLSNIEIRLSDGEKAYSDMAGHFLFQGLYPGEYAVGVNTAQVPGNFKLTSPSPVPLVLSDGLTAYVEFRFVLKKEEEVGKASIDGLVFFDKNSNGQYDRGEPLAKEFRAVLDGRLVAYGKEGVFKFSHINPGRHRIEIFHDRGKKEVEVDIKEGVNRIEIPLKFSGITVIIRGEK